MDQGAEGEAGEAIVDEEERDGIKDVAEDAREGEEDDAGVGGEGEALGGDVGEDVVLEGGGFEAREGEVIAVAEIVEVPAVVGEAADAGGGGVDLVEVEGEEEDAVSELVDFGGEAAVPDAAFVEAGLRSWGGRHGGSGG